MRVHLPLHSLISFFAAGHLIAGSVAVVPRPEPPRKQPATRLQEPAVRARAAAEYGRLPLYFEPNLGQTDPRVQFLARAGGYTMFLTPGEAVMVLSRGAKPDSDHDEIGRAPARFEQAVVRMKVEGASPDAVVRGLERQPGISAYFLGNDPAKWCPEVPHYAKVTYEQVYPGVDLVYYGNQRTVEYDFVVAPGADPSQIQLAYEGAERLRLDESGDLVLTTRLGDLKQHRPLVHQEVRGQRVAVAANYRLRGNTLGVELAAYDRTRPLVIDPVLEYSTYLGGSGDDYGQSIKVDSAGAVYIAGYTASADYPPANAVQPNNLGGSYDAFVTKLKPRSGATPIELAYSTYLGGTGEDRATGVGVDSTGAAYVAGYTGSLDLPVLNALQATYGGGDYDAFVFKLNAYTNGAVTLGYSTYLGGNAREFGRGLDVGASGTVYVTGYTASQNFPTVDAFQASLSGSGDAFVSKLSPHNGAGAVTLDYSTYLGSTGDDSAYAIRSDAAGAAYVTGYASGAGFPKLNDSSRGSFGAFVTKLDPHDGAGSVGLAYSALFGSGDERVASIAVDSAGAAYVIGSTLPSARFPAVNYYVAPQAVGIAAFAVKLSAFDGSTPVRVVYGTYLSDTQSAGTGIEVDAAGAAYVVGQVSGSDFATEGAFQVASKGSGDGFLAKLDPCEGTDTVTLAYWTYLAGSGIDKPLAVALDRSGVAYVTGATRSTDFPTLNAIQTDTAGGYDAFLARLTCDPPEGFPAPVIDSISPVSPVVTGYTTEVIVSGSGFQNHRTVTVTAPEGVSYTSSWNQITKLSSNALRVALPLRSLGTWSMRVNNPDGKQSASFSFTVVLPAPVVSVPWPTISASPREQTLSVNGSGFVSGVFATLTKPSGATLTFSGAAVTFVSSSTFRINAVFDTPGTWSVRATNPDGQSSATKTFVVKAGPPAIASVSPATPVVSASNQTLTVNGSGFQAGLSVSVSSPQSGTFTLSGAAVQNITSASFQLSVALNSAGSWMIRVINPDGQTSSSYTFTVRNPAPSIGSVAPATPTASAGAQLLTVTGGNFQAGMTVKVTPPSGTPSTLSGPAIQNLTATTFQLTLVLDKPGTWSIQVVNPDTQSSATFSFAVQAPLPPPSISAIAPASPTVNAVAKVLRVYGAGFQSGLTVRVIPPGGTPSTLSGSAIQNVFATSFQVTLVLNSVGTWNLQVANPDAQVSGVLSFTVQAVVAPPPSITFISPSAPAASADAQTLTVAGSGFQSGLTVTATPPGGSPVIVEGAAIQNVTAASFQLVMALNSAGVWSLRVRNQDAQLSNAFSITVGPGRPTFSAAGVVSAASFAGGAVSPGEIVAVFGSDLGPANGITNSGFDPGTGRLPTILGGVRVTFDGQPAPLFYVSNGQVNLQVPYEVAGRSATEMVVIRDGVASVAGSVPVSPVRPGVFAANGRALVTDTLTGALITPSAPAVRGRYITVWATGFGVVNPPVATGAPASSTSLSHAAAVMAVGSATLADIQFAGLTPGMVGLAQVNIKIPDNAPSDFLLWIYVNSVMAEARIDGALTSNLWIPIR